MSLDKTIKNCLTGMAAAGAMAIAGNARAEKPFDYIEYPAPEARLGVLAFNVGVNTAVCGITAAVEKRDVLEDMGKCFAGSTLQYAGMEMMVHDVPVLPGMGRNLVQLGTSIVDNTVAGEENPLKYISYDLGPGMFQIDTETGETNFYWRILPLYGIFANVEQGNTFDWMDSLSYQTLVFHTKADAILDKGQGGLTIGNVINYDPNYRSFLAHEYIHDSQYIRLRPTQQLVPEFLSPLEEELHLRIGEDLSYALLTLPQVLCRAADGENSTCGRTWSTGFPLEFETYYMQTGNENLLDDERNLREKRLQKAREKKQKR